MRLLAAELLGVERNSDVRRVHELYEGSGMAYIVKAYIVVACIVMVYIAMHYIVMAVCASCTNVRV